MDAEEFERRFKDKERRSYLKYKQEVKINIYGAFSGGRIEKLKKLRDFLRKNGYNARISTDLEEIYPRGENEGDDEYNRRISELFINDGDIHIFVFFTASEGEKDLNQSAAMELESIYRLGKDEYVIIYFEDGSWEQVRTLLRGLVRKKGWDHEIFKEIEDIFEDALSFCSNCIRKIFDEFREESSP